MTEQTATPTETAPAPETEAAPEATPGTPAGKTFSQADIDQIKADADRRISTGINKGIATREKELKDEAETATLKAANDFEGINKKQAVEIKTLRENAERADYLRDNNLTQYAPAFEGVAISKLPEVAKTITDTVNAAVLAGISAKLETPAPPEGAPPTTVAIKDMTPEQWEVERKKRGIT